MRLYCEKLGIPHESDEDDPDRDAALEWGHVQEEVIADWYARERSVYIFAVPPIRWPGDWPFWATLDRKCHDNSRIVEIKNVGSPRMYRHWDASSADGIPNYVRAQVTIQMCFTGIHTCDVVACVGGRPPHVWTVFYDDELAHLLLEGAKKFWRLVESDTPPTLDGSKATRAYLLHKYPQESDRVVEDCTEEEHQLAIARASASALSKKYARDMAELDAKLLSLIGNRAGIKGEEWSMTWKTDKNGNRRQRFTWRED
jgi:predicted phage-related endonuclease